MPDYTGDIRTTENLSRTAKNKDCSTGPLAHPFARSLAPLTRSHAPDCSLRSRPPLRSLIHSLVHYITLTPSSVFFPIFDQSVRRFCVFSILLSNSHFLLAATMDALTLDIYFSRSSHVFAMGHGFLYPRPEVFRSEFVFFPLCTGCRGCAYCARGGICKWKCVPPNEEIISKMGDGRFVYKMILALKTF